MLCKIMQFWQDLLDSLNSDGGHILALIFLVLLGLAAEHFKVNKADELFIGAFTALLVLLKTAGSNKTRRDRPVPTTETTTATITETATKENQ